MNVTAVWYDEHTGDGGDFLGAFDETVSIAHQSREPLYWLGR